jgi:hypothetical protein
MPTARVNGVPPYHEETGCRLPLVWCHEFGGDYRSWEPQLRYFSSVFMSRTPGMRGLP